MAVSVDQKVVQMQFDNAQFEKGVQETLNSLNKLNASVEANTKQISSGTFDGLSEGLENSSKAANKMSDAVDIMRDKFGVFGTVADQAIRKITDKMLGFASSAAKTVTGINDMASGFQKYNQKTSAVATLMTATGASIEDVTKTLSDLQWFTDETSYNFTDMIDTMSKMSASGEKDLTKLLRFTEGFALAAAKAGVGASTTSRAMYQLTQAASRGYIQYQDWQQALGTTNIATDDLKKRMIAAGGAAAEAAGANEDFNSSLRKGWLTIDVFASVMDDFTEGVNSANYENGDFINSCNGAAGATTKFSEEAFRAAQECRTWQDVVDAVKDSIGSGWSNSFEIILGDANEVRALFTGIANAVIEVADSITSARNEALQGWKDLGGREDFLKIIANTINSFYRVIHPIFVALNDTIGGTAAENLKSVTGSLADFTERLKVSEATMQNIYTVAKRIFSAIKNVFQTIKPFWKQIASLIIVISMLKTIKGLFSGGLGLNKVFGVIKLMFGIGILKGLLGIKDSSASINDVLSKSAIVVSNLGKKIGAVFKNIKSSKIGQTIITVLKTVGKVFEVLIALIVKGIMVAINKVKSIPWSKVDDFFKNLGATIKGFFDLLGKWLTGIKDFHIKSFADLILIIEAAIQKLKDTLAGLFGKGTGLDKIIELLPGIKKDVNEISSSVSGNVTRAVGPTSTFANVLSSLKIYLEEASYNFGKFGENVRKFVSSVNWAAVLDFAVIILYILQLRKLNKSVQAVGNTINIFIKNITGPLYQISASVSGMFGSIKQYFNQLTKNEKGYVKAFKNISIGIALLVGSFVLLTTVDYSKVQNAAIAMGVLAGAAAGLLILFTILSRKIDPKGVLALAIAMASFGAMLLEFSIVLAVITAIVQHFIKMSSGWDQFIARVAAPIGVLIGLVVAMGIAIKVLASAQPILLKAAGGLAALSGSLLLFGVSIVGVAISIQVAIIAFGLVITELKAFGLAIIAWVKGMAKIGTLGSDVAATLVGVAVAIGGFIAIVKVAEYVGNKLTNMTLKLAGSFLLLSVSLVDIASAVKILSTTSSGILDGIAGLVTGVALLMAMFVFLSSETVQKATENIKACASAMLKVSISLLVLAGATAAFSKIAKNPAQYWQAIGGLAGEIIVLAFAVKIMDKCNVEKVAAALLGFVVALYMLIPIIALLSITAPVMWKGIALMSAFMLALAYSTKLLNEAKPGSVISILVTYGLVVTLISKVLMQLSQIPFEKSLGAAASLALVMWSMAESIRLIAESTGGMNREGTGIKKLFAFVVSISAMTASMWVMGTALQKLATLPWPNMMVAAASMAGLMGRLGLMVSAMLKVANKTKTGKKALQQLLSVFIMMGALVASMAALTLLVQTIAALPVKQAMASAIMLAALMAVFTAAIAILGVVSKVVNPTAMLAMSVAMVAFAASMAILSVALQQMTEIPWLTLVLGIGLFTVAIAALGLISTIANPVTLLALSVAMIAMGAGMLVMALAMQQLATVPWYTIVLGLVAFVGGLGLLIAIVALLPGAKLALLALGAACLGIGVGIGVAAAGIALLTMAISMLLPEITQFITSMVQLSGQAGNIMQMATAISNMGVALIPLGIGLLAAGAGALVAAVGFGALALAAILMNAALQACGPLIDAIKTAFNGLSEIVKKAATWMKDFIDTIVNGLKSGVDKVKNAAKAIANGIASFLHFSLPEEEPLHSAPQWMKDFIDLLVSGIKDNGGKLIDGIKDLAGNAKDGFTSVIGDTDLGSLLENIDTSKIKSFFGDLGSESGSSFINKLLSAIGIGSKKVTYVTQEQAIKLANGELSKEDVYGSNDWGDLLGLDDLTSKLGDTSDSMDDFTNATDLASTSLDGGSGSGSLSSSADEASDSLVGLQKVTVSVYGTLNEAISKVSVQNGKFLEAFTKVEPIKVAQNAVLAYAKNITIAGIQAEDGISKAAAAAKLAAMDTNEQLKKIQESFNEFYGNIKDSISNFMNVFEAPSEVGEISKEELEYNLQETINRVKQWGYHMNILADRGIDDGLYKKLAEMGPEGEKYVRAFMTMTQEELANYGDLFEQSLTIPDETTQAMLGHAVTTGQYIVQGLQQGLQDSGMSEEAARQLATNTLNALDTAAEVHSPSRATYRTGVFLVQGFNNGLNSRIGDAIIKTYAAFLNIKKAVANALKEDDGIRIGKNFGAGVINGILQASEDFIQEGLASKEMLEQIQEHGTKFGTSLLLGMAMGLGSEGEEEDYTPSIYTMALGQALLAGFAQAFEENFEDFQEEILEYFKQLILAICEIFGVETDEAGGYTPSLLFYNLVMAMFLGAQNAMDEQFPLAIIYITIQLTNIVNIVKTILSYQNGYYIGQNWVQGIIDGIESKIEEAAEKAAELAEAIEKATSSGLQEHSPSRLSKKFGEYWDIGLANGITSAVGVVERATGSMTGDMINNMQTALETANAIMNDEVDVEPTITPVLNLDDIRSGFRTLGSMTNGGFKVNGQLGKVNTQTSVLSSLYDKLNGSNEPSQNVFNFNQNNYSPKALSRIDIYRQTRSQFAQFRGAVNAK